MIIQRYTHKQPPFLLKHCVLFSILFCCITGCVKDDLARGKKLLASGDFLSARKTYERIIRKLPENFEAHYGLGMSWCAEAMYKTELGLAAPQDWYPAIYQMSVASNFTTGDQAYRTLAILHYNLGACYRKNGRTDDAILRVQQAVSYDSTLLKAYNMLGALYQEKGDLDKADLCYRHALILKPDYAPAHFNRGALAWARGDAAAAEKCFADAVACEPQNAAFQEWLSKARAATGGR
jgi:tetratricopeptide (TPR) repeat protein